MSVNIVRTGHAQTAELAAESLLDWPEITPEERVVLEAIRDRAAAIRAEGEKDWFSRD
jgi:hypothetical protein